jgi:Tat protein secretion system quality control protein TatD with DNase activity
MENTSGFNKKEGSMLIDSHAHLDMKDFDKDREKVLERALEGGISQIITVGIDLKSSLIGLDLTQKYECVYSSVGFHPHNADGCDLQTLNQLAELASEPKRGKRNEPQFVTFTAKEIARLRKTDYEDLALQITENARILFGLP